MHHLFNKILLAMSLTLAITTSSDAIDKEKIWVKHTHPLTKKIESLLNQHALITKNDLKNFLKNNSSEIDSEIKGIIKKSLKYTPKKIDEEDEFLYLKMLPTLMFGKKNPFEMAEDFYDYSSMFDIPLKKLKATYIKNLRNKNECLVGKSLLEEDFSEESWKKYKNYTLSQYLQHLKIDSQIIKL